MNTRSLEERLTELEREVCVLRDKQEIHDLLMKYCRGVDRGDRNLIAEVFHPDGVDDHGDFVVNASDVPDLFVAMVKRSPKGGMHFIGNILIELDGDTAYAESYFWAVKDVDRGDGSVIRIRAGRYVDRLERRGGKWQVHERVLVDEFNRIDSVSESIGPRERYQWGRRDRDDPVYAIRRGRVARVPKNDLAEIAARKIG